MHHCLNIHISYPPISTNKGTPLLSQNRQFQYFNEPTFIYPMVPASAATLLKKRGYNVVWDDAIAEQMDYDRWLANIGKTLPDLIAIETKTPTVNLHWKTIKDIKNISPNTITVLYGDHVTALPEESLINSPVDYIIVGGYYDVILHSLVHSLDRNEPIGKGIWYRENGHIRNKGLFSQRCNLNDLPFIDRDLTKWELYSKHNGNYKYTPGTYTMVGRDCWYRSKGGCTFCSWTTTYPTFNLRSPESLLDEIGLLIERLGVREIFDDTGTFPIGNWLRRFSEGMIDRGYNREVLFGCNMRFGALSSDDFKLMKKAGFRFLLYGLESANQKTLNLLNKGITAKEQFESCKKAAEAGLDPHLTIMFGYPWEKKAEAIRTIDMAKALIKKGYAKTWQVTIMIPYPGTKLFNEAKSNGWLKTEDWARYDMRESILNTPLSEEEVLSITQSLYKVALDPEFIIRKIVGIRNLDDVKFIMRGARNIFGHIKDFNPNQ